MAVITPSPSGSAITYRAAANGDTYANSGREKVHVRNGGVASTTVILVRTAQCNQGVVHAGAGALAADTFVIPAGEDRILPAVSADLYGASVGLTYSVLTSVTVAVLGG